MRITKHVLIVTAAVLLPQIAAAGAPPPVTVTLEAMTPTTLPGIPVGLRVTIESTAGESIALPREAFLLVRNERGETFPARTANVTTAIHEANDALYLEDWPDARIKPRGKMTLDIETEGVLGEPAWFRDERLEEPGRYELQLLVGNFISGERRLDALHAQLTASNWTELRVLQPEGDDATVRQALIEFRRTTSLRERAHGTSEGKLWKDLTAKYPRSAYVGWLLATGVGGTGTESNGLLRQWLESHTGDPHQDWRWLIVARYEFIAQRSKPRPKRHGTRKKHATSSSG